MSAEWVPENVIDSVAQAIRNTSPFFKDKAWEELRPRVAEGWREQARAAIEAIQVALLEHLGPDLESLRDDNFFGYGAAYADAITLALAPTEKK